MLACGKRAAVPSEEPLSTMKISDGIPASSRRRREDAGEEIGAVAGWDHDGDSGEGVVVSSEAG